METFPKKCSEAYHENGPTGPQTWSGVHRPGPCSMGMTRNILKPVTGGVGWVEVGIDYMINMPRVLTVSTRPVINI